MSLDFFLDLALEWGFLSFTESLSSNAVLCSQETLGSLLRNLWVGPNFITSLHRDVGTHGPGQNSFLFWKLKLLHIRYQFQILCHRVGMGVGPYSSESRAFCLFQQFPLSCPLLAFRLAVLSLGFSVFWFSVQVVLGGFDNRYFVDD